MSDQDNPHPIHKPTNPAPNNEADARTLPNGRGSALEDVAAYFITYHTFGTWLHGDERGSVDPKHNRPETDFLPSNSPRQRSCQDRMKQDAVTLDAQQRSIVERTITGVAEHRGWSILALAVRTNHVHVVVTANVTPEKVMNDFKSWSTRRLVEAGVFPQGKKVWVRRHGSTRYLWDDDAVDNACTYVVEGQGADLPKSEPHP